MLSALSSAVEATTTEDGLLRARGDRQTEDASQIEAETADSTDDSAFQSTDLSLDAIFSILSNSRRRGVVYCLERVDEPLDVSRLTTLVTAMENGVPPGEVTYTQRKRVYTSLHQSHLPKMDDVGIVDFDRDAGTVEPASGLEEISSHLDAIRSSQRSWSGFCFGAGALSIAVWLLGWFSVSPFGLLSGITYVSVLAIALLTIGIFHRSHVHTRASEDDLDVEVIETV